MGKCNNCGKKVDDDLIRLGWCPDCYESTLHKKHKKIYKLGDTYFNIENITSISEPEFYNYISDALKDKYVETPTKEVKSLSVYIDGKEFTSENYWDSDYNRGISLKGEELYKQHEKEVKEIFNAFINLDGEENDRN